MVTVDINLSDVTLSRLCRIYNRITHKGVSLSFSEFLTYALEYFAERLLSDVGVSDE